MPTNDSASFPFRFIDVHAGAVRDRHREQFFEVPLILMDLEMPVIDRWQPVRALKNDPQTCHIPIIGISAYALDSERETAIATGCNEFDTKPIEFEGLIGTIRRLVANPR